MCSKFAFVIFFLQEVVSIFLKRKRVLRKFGHRKYLRLTFALVTVRFHCIVDLISGKSD